MKISVLTVVIFALCGAFIGAMFGLFSRRPKYYRPTITTSNLDVEITRYGFPDDECVNCNLKTKCLKDCIFDEDTIFRTDASVKSFPICCKMDGEDAPDAIILVERGVSLIEAMCVMNDKLTLGLVKAGTVLHGHVDLEKTMKINKGQDIS